MVGRKGGWWEGREDGGKEGRMVGRKGGWWEGRMEREGREGWRGKGGRKVSEEGGIIWVVEGEHAGEWPRVRNNTSLSYALLHPSVLH